MEKKSERNKPCKCGSGKKYKYCCYGKKPSYDTVTVDFGVRTTINDYRISSDGTLTLLKDGEVVRPEKAWGTTQRDRTKSEKILNRAPISPSDLRFGAHSDLTGYDYIFSIDTNTVQNENKKVSVSCIMQTVIYFDKKELLQRSIALCAIYILEAKNKAENLCWHILITMIQKSFEYNKNSKIAIITDSDLGQHHFYNERTQPYFEKNFLPENFTLLYASDKGPNFQNKIIHKCDIAARTLMNNILSGKVVVDDAYTVHNGPCEKIKFYKNGNKNFDEFAWFQLGKMPSLDIRTIS